MIRDLTTSWQAASPAERTALVGLLLFGLIGPLGPAATALSLLVMLCATAMQRDSALRSLALTPLGLIFIALSVYVLGRAGFAANEFPTIAGEQWDEATDLMYPILLLPLAWWLRGDPRRIIALLTLALAGFCIDMLVELDWSRLDQFLDGRRNSITGSKLSTALYTGTGILGLIAFAPRIGAAMLGMRAPYRVLTFALLITACVMLITAQLITQSRIVWVSLMALIPLLLAVQWWTVWRPRLGRPLAYLLIVTAVVAAVGGAALAADRIEKRMMQEAEVIERVAEGKLSGIGYSSIGARVHLWDFSAELIGERPVFGWGPGTRATRFMAPRRDEPKLVPFGDLHNTWVEITYRLGFIGLLLYAALIGVVLHAGYRAWRNERVPLDLSLFMGSALLLTGAWTMINCRILNPDFQYFVMLLFASIYTFALTPPPERPPRPEHGF